VSLISPGILKLASLLLERIAPIILFTLIVLIAFYLIRLRKEFFAMFPKPSLRTFILLTAICISFFLVEIAYSPAMPVYITDEFEYAELAKNIRNKGEANFYCLMDDHGQRSCLTPYVTLGFPVFLSIVVFAFGMTYLTAAYVNIFIATFALVLVFLMSLAFFRNENIALVSALFLAIIPYYNYWSGTGEPHPLSLVTIILSFLFLHMYLQKPSIKKLVIFLAGFVYMLYSRHEHIFLLPLYIYFFMVFRKKPVRNYVNTKSVLVAAGFLVLLIPNLLQMFVFSYDLSGNPGMYYAEDAFSLKNVPESFDRWVIPFYTNESQPILLNIFFFIGAAVLLADRKSRHLGIFLLSFFIIIQGAFMLYYGYSIGGRALFPSYIPLSVVGAVGFVFVASKLSRLFRFRYLALLLLAVTIVSVIPVFNRIVLNYHNLDTHYNMELRRTQADFIANWQPDDGTLYLAAEPIMYLVQHTPKMMNARHIIENPEVRQMWLDRGYNIVFLEDYFCYNRLFQPSRIKHCSDIIDMGITSVSILPERPFDYKEWLDNPDPED
jgi:hypothetical protein